MLYRIHRGGVPGFSGNQCELVYLVSRLSRVHQHNLDWVATDRNAVLNTTRFVNQVEDLRTLVDWPLMREKMWNNTAEDPDRMQRRMAELLIHCHAPWPVISFIGVCSDVIRDGVSKLVSEPTTWRFLSDRHGIS